ncbi:MAG: hypothetical protein WC860_06035 [Candidatus Margulisiibacteriota bacterium]|jgi:hypothetical protein
MDFENKLEINNFEQKKKKFFTNFALKFREQFKLHEQHGLWEKQDSWKNVSEHCLVEAARCEIFAEKLELSKKITDYLVQAGILHDFYKKQEIIKTKNQDKSYEAFANIYEQAHHALQAAKISQEIIDITDKIDQTAFDDIEIMLSQKELSEKDVASLVLNYVDSYTINTEWAVTASLDENNKKINDLDKRVLKNMTNPNYQKINEQGKKYFNGMTTYEKQLEIGNRIEKRLTELLNQKNNLNIDQKDLPTFIDGHIKEKIKNIE